MKAMCSRLIPEPESISHAFDHDSLLTDKEERLPDNSLCGSFFSGDVMNIFLIGYMGTGKSAAGRETARLTGCKWLDLDELTEERIGMTISDYMHAYGEEAFRDRESETLSAFLNDVSDQSTDILLSCGGGVVLRRENRETLKQNGFVIRLTASPETVLERVKTGGSVRPLLRISQSDEELLQQIRNMMQEREQYYVQTADATIGTDGRKPSETAELIRMAAGI